MKMEKNKLSFALTPNTYGNGYFAHVKHTQVIGSKEALKDLSEMPGDFHIPECTIAYILKRASAYIDQQLRKGYQVTVGGFRVGLAIEGTFDSANAPFDPEKHRLKVIAVPRKAMQKAVEDLAPVNETVDEAPILETVWGASHTKNVLESGGNCGANGRNLIAGPGKGIDRIWLENASGEAVATGSVTACDVSRLEFTIPTGIAPGEYLLVMERPNKDGATRSRVRHKVSVV